MPTTEDHRDDRTGESNGPPELDSRKAAILNAVVAEYIGTAQPVGSQHVVDSAGVSVSSATVRSDMAALERDGFLAQPHTSAGRIPTDKGYRFFVDHLAGPGSLDPGGRPAGPAVLRPRLRRDRAMLERTSGLLADLTDYTAMVVGPSHESAAIRSVQLVGLGPRLALLVVVLADGAVEKRSIEFAQEVDEAVLSTPPRVCAPMFWARPWPRCRRRVKRTGDPITDAVVASGVKALRSLGSAEAGDQVFVGGSSRMAAAFDAVETVRSVLTILEQQLVVVTLLRDILDTGLTVAIGTEHGLEPLASCASWSCPSRSTVRRPVPSGWSGPTRMNYPLALAAARVVGDQLGQRLSESRTMSEGPWR